MRLFIAIQIPEVVKKYIISMQQEFQEFPLRFVKHEQMHLTIDFLGEIPENRIEGIINDLDKIISVPFRIRLINLGTFPSTEKIRVLWIGIDKNDTFIELQKNIRKTFNHRGKLMPHLTIARAKDIMTDKNLTDAIRKVEMRPQIFQSIGSSCIRVNRHLKDIYIL